MYYPFLTIRTISLDTPGIKNILPILTFNKKENFKTLCCLRNVRESLRFNGHF